MGSRRPAVRHLPRPSPWNRCRGLWGGVLYPDSHRAAAASHARPRFHIASSPLALKRNFRRKENDMSQPILVTGAAGGGQGSTGRRVTESLLERGFSVRALVHKLDDRSDRLAAIGAEVKEGDLLNPGSVREALHGI